MKKSIVVLFAVLGFNAAVAKINIPAGDLSNGLTTATQTVTTGTSDSSHYHSGSTTRKRKPSTKNNPMDTSSTSSKNSFTPRAGAGKSSRNSDTTGAPYHK